jgi:hypothetical protein
MSGRLKECSVRTGFDADRGPMPPPHLGNGAALIGELGDRTGRSGRGTTGAGQSHYRRHTIASTV